MLAKMIPHPIPYQGSKRKLAPVIAELFPKKVETLYEPFAGSAAMTIYAAKHNLAEKFVIGDTFPELVTLWEKIINHPDEIAKDYEKIWLGHIENGNDHFNTVRASFNETRDEAALLYLVARCVKNAVRFNKNGFFTQSADKRRLGTNPLKMAVAIKNTSQLLKGKTKVICDDFSNTIKNATPNDLVYLDPPYHGTTYGKDKRYFSQLEREELIFSLTKMNDKKVPFLLSYDGMTGSTVYGAPLPDDLKMHRLLLLAGRSTQSTLSGRDEVTVESLYVSPGLATEIPVTHRESTDKLKKLLLSA